jgi:hypothetical protein
VTSETEAALQGLNESDSSFKEVRPKGHIVAFFLGMALIGACIPLGRSYVFFIFFLVFSIFMTLRWRNSPRPWIFLTSVSAAIPTLISRYELAGNLLFASWYLIFKPRYLFRLPTWIYLPSILAVLGVLTSSVNWATADIARTFMRQVTHAYNLFLAPFLLLPAVYLRMKESRDHSANLWGLLFCLILPTTLLLCSARLFGRVTNAWEASQHFRTLAEGFFMYQIGRVTVNFLRTEVGFILAALTCASAAVAASQVKGFYRLIAGACLAANVFLLLVTGSFGSIAGCLCGLAAIFYFLFRTVSSAKVVVSGAVICCVLGLTFVALPSNVKGYLGKRYEYRVTNADTDRLALWERALEQLSRHPEGVGFTMSIVGGTRRTFIHNEYLTYTVSYGIFGGLGYLLLVLGLLISFFRMPKGAIRDPATHALHLAGLGVLVAVSLNSMTDHMNENRWYFNIIWSMIWYCYACSRAGGTGDLCQDRIAHEPMATTTLKDVHDERT